MVTANAERSADAIADMIQGRELMAVGASVVAVTGGLFLGQEVADQVLPLLDFPVDPSQPMDLGASALVKLLAVIPLLAVGGYFGGAGMAIAGLAAYGVLASAGLDLFDLAQRQGVPGSTPSLSGGSGSPKIPSPASRGSSSSPTPATSSGTVRRASASSGGSGGGFRGT